ncbi:hypothetical protein A2160_05240 [Candidatus Beckwithbacteria bacterium RBG_13_42_9]|uniref:Uncharacterized protein n=1 Tax=Candidatus Beckwithbacteria bacterium RBG_13_42_9 TaxID=1797457 RepID=A0A1F5E6Q9_9BACT|nr:MAG: hypothetical protein A2160_05240 [Candidatus Beckwithbacteria bacterium RBG_13_42_9]
MVEIKEYGLLGQAVTAAPYTVWMEAQFSRGCALKLASVTGSIVVVTPEVLTPSDKLVFWDGRVGVFGAEGQLKGFGTLHLCISGTLASQLKALE